LSTLACIANFRFASPVSNFKPTSAGFKFKTGEANWKVAIHARIGNLDSLVVKGLNLSSKKIKEECDEVDEIKKV
jgi:hypothetical protein